VERAERLKKFEDRFGSNPKYQELQKERAALGDPYRIDDEDIFAGISDKYATNILAGIPFCYYDVRALTEEARAYVSSLDQDPVVKEQSAAGSDVLPSAGMRSPSPLAEPTVIVAGGGGCLLDLSAAATQPVPTRFESAALGNTGMSNVDPEFPLWP
jgi:hypothetical protein